MKTFRLRLVEETIRQLDVNSFTTVGQLKRMLSSLGYPMEKYSVYIQHAEDDVDTRAQDNWCITEGDTITLRKFDYYNAEEDRTVRQITDGLRASALLENRKTKGVSMSVIIGGNILHIEDGKIMRITKVNR